MTEEQKAAYINAMASVASIEAAAMHAENFILLRAGSEARWTGDDFRALIDRHGIHHNAVISFFHDDR